MKDKTRYGGNYLNVNDENKPPYSPFYLMICGHIESAEIPAYDGICCKYDFISGTDWGVVDGNKSGVSQHSYKAQQTNKRVVFSYPFEVQFRSYNVTGWPNIVLTMTSRDFLGRDIICGYGVVNVPT